MPVDVNMMTTMASNFSTEDVGRLLILSSIKLKSPMLDFLEREADGDFLPIQRFENPNRRHWKAGREPLDDDELEKRREAISKVDVYWGSEFEISGLDLLYHLSRRFDKVGMYLLAEAAAAYGNFCRYAPIERDGRCP